MPGRSRYRPMPDRLEAALLEVLLLILTAVCTHLVMSLGQTLLHRWVGHHPLGGPLYRNHIKFHHTYYARGHLASETYRGNDGNNTPYFLVPTLLVGGVLFFVLPLSVFVAMVLTSSGSFYAHVLLDREYHVENSRLQRFTWFRRKQQLHFVHHLHADANFAVIDFAWDKLLGTYRRPDSDTK
jgi:sterol desaturase/sphingolipid hydroxylase (fatty acid hydroxylase superfamily)